MYVPGRSGVAGRAGAGCRNAEPQKVSAAVSTIDFVTEPLIDAPPAGPASGAAHGPPERGAQTDIARVAVDLALPHLDRFFDYAIPEAMASDVRPGVRVRVRFAGRLCDGFVVDVGPPVEPERKLAPVHKVVSTEQVFTPETVELVRAVADHYAGTFSDVMRLAVPPRHATTEKAARRERPAAEVQDVHQPITEHPWGRAWLDAVRRGESPRAFWQVTPVAAPVGDWASGLAGAAATAVRAGRGALLIVPDARDVARLELACRAALGASGFVTLTADLGPAARYRAFLAALRGDVPVVIGTRAAAFAPVQNLGLIALWDDGDDLLSEPRAPYPHARDVLAIRAGLRSGSPPPALLYAAYGRTAEIQRWLDRQWLLPIAETPARTRQRAPLVRVAADTDLALERDPAARAARVPHDAFTVLRTGLAQGPVLVQVPRSGYQVALVCQECRTPARCDRCGGPLAGAAHGQVQCRWCGRLATDHRCEECGSRRLRAPVVGASRTAEEFGKAFPSTAIIRSGGGTVIDEVGDRSSLVIATPGAEPRADGGYAAALLLDTQLLLGRADLRAGEEALRRWLNVTALVRPGSQGGTVLAVGDASARPLQGLVRLDPGGFAERELTDRERAGLPPAAKLVTVEGRGSALHEFQAALRAPASTQLLGPMEIGTQPGSDELLLRLALQAPLADADTLVAAVKAAVGVRSARKEEGALRVRVDPAGL